MSEKKTPLEELKQSKLVLQKQIKEQENLMFFKNKKQSLSLITHGFTDKFLRNEPNNEGGMKTVIDKSVVVKEIGNNIKNRLINKDIFTQIINGGMKENNIEGILKTGLILGIGALARKKMKSGGIKNKIIGAALLYIAPYALKFAQRKITEYQQKKSITSLEKII